MMRRSRLAIALASAVAFTAVALPQAAGARVALGFVAGPHTSHQAMTAIKAANATHIREQFSWAEAEPRRGVANWAPLDADMVEASKANMPIVAVLSATPEWAIDRGTPRGGQDTYPTRVADLTAWVARASQRYSPGGVFWAEHPDLVPKRLITWQVWNEPNIASAWTGGVASPQRYADLLTRTRDAIRASDRGATIQAAGMTSGGAGSSRPDAFLKGVWRWLGPIRSSLYKWDIHAYSDTPAHAASLIPWMRQLMDANGCRGCKMVVGEFGWASGSGINQRYGWLCAGSEARQAQMGHTFLATVLRDAAANRVVELSWYRWDDPSPSIGASGCFRSLGVVNYLGVPKPALAYFKRFST